MAQVIVNVRRAEPRQHESGTAGRKETAVFDGYALWVKAVMAVVESVHDVRDLESWPAVLSEARSLSAIRHWCLAVSLPAKASLNLGRCLRAFVHGQRTGRDPRVFLAASTRATTQRFWRTAGLIRDESPPMTLDECLERQQFIADRDALDALREALRCQLPGLR